MANNKLTTTRLHKQEASFLKDPMQHAFVVRDGHLNFYFCIYNLDEPFKNGFYFGLLELHPNYPFAAPKLFFYTPNGRYEVNMAICTSFTNYHQQSWTSAWNVRSLINGTISFMFSSQSSYGCRTDKNDAKMKFARESLSWNMNNQKFKKFFGGIIRAKLPDLIKLGITINDKKLLKECNIEQQVKSDAYDIQAKLNDSLEQNNQNKSNYEIDYEENQPQNIQYVDEIIELNANELGNHMELHQQLIDEVLPHLDEEKEQIKKIEENNKQKRKAVAIGIAAVGAVAVAGYLIFTYCV